jgi:GTPase
MRALTGSEVLVADKLFATLDMTVRALKPETKPRMLVSDTVGFIKKLPHDLVASFDSPPSNRSRARLLRNCLRSDDARSAGDRREFLEPLLAEHRRAVDVVALLRHGADDPVTERLHEAAQLLDARGVRDIVGRQEAGCPAVRA